MPILKNSIALDIARGLRAFLKLEMGVVRGAMPAQDQGAAKRQLQQLARLRRQVEAQRQQLSVREARIEKLKEDLSRSRTSRPRRMSPDRMVWIFCTPRSGSTWLYNMLQSLSGYETWHEPLIGKLFGDFYEKNTHRGGRHYIMGGKRQHWLGPVRSFALEAAGAKFPKLLNSGYLAVKEPGSAIGAPILMEALPESRMIFLLRDPRDVAASSFDAYSKGGWFRERRENIRPGTSKMFSRYDDNPVAQTESVAKGYLAQVEKAGEAYDQHEGPKTLVRYEDLVADTLGEMIRMHEELGIAVDSEELSRVVREHSWDNIPEENRGAGKFYRKGTPGSWREDLSGEQVEAVERITAPLIERFYTGRS